MFVEIGENEKRELLRIARQSLTNYFLKDKNLDFVSNATIRADLVAGAFVTLYVPQGKNLQAPTESMQLRGCIGNIYSTLPLSQLISDLAIKAATRDPRFSPLLEDELANVLIEISILSPLQVVEDIDEIQIGVHGLLITCRGQRGLLLPPVPVKYGWGREEYLRNLCYKAGLPEDTWRVSGCLQKFTTIQFK